jgi:hypothetical protein
MLILIIYHFHVGVGIHLVFVLWERNDQGQGHYVTNFGVESLSMNYLLHTFFLSVLKEMDSLGLANILIEDGLKLKTLFDQVSTNLVFTVPQYV